VAGVPTRKSGVIRAAISDQYVSGRRRVVRESDEGRDAVTHYRVREAYRHAALLELELETGRQHQIRLHLQQLGHPLIGERVYTTERDVRASTARLPARIRAPRQMLHAWRLRFPHPTRDAIVAVEAPLPADMSKLIRTLTL
jgi:23S rRNA pseudouridine1911/1915/1917 synthase